MKWFSRRPFAALLISMALVAFLPLLLDNLFYARFQSTVVEQQKSLTGESLRFSVQQLDKTLSELANLSVRLSSSIKSAEIPRESEMTAKSRLALRELSIDLQRATESASSYIDAIYLYSANSQRAAGNQGAYSEEMTYRKFYRGRNISLEKMQELHGTFSYGQLAPLDDSSMVFIRTVSKRRDGTPEKQLVLMVDLSFCGSLIDSANVEGGVFLLSDNQGSVLALSNKTGAELEEGMLEQIAEGVETEDFRINGKRALLYSLGISTGGYRVKAVVPYSQLLDANQELHLYHLLIFVASVVLSLLLAVFLSRRSVMPLNQIIDYIRENYGAAPEDTWGLERIRSAVDDLLDQRRTAREKLGQYETVIARNSLRDALRGNARDGDTFHLPEGSRYAVVCFSAEGTPLEPVSEQIQLAAKKTLPQECFCRSVVQDGRVVQVMALRDPGFDEAQVEKLLTEQISRLDGQGKYTVSAAYSDVHEDHSELDRAYGEASIAMTLAYTRDDVLTSFSGCETLAPLFLRDWHHLDKQLLLASLVGEGRFSEALGILSELFPAEFLEEYFPESEISKLHLASLKYQFLHDMDAVATVTGKSESFWGGSLQELLYCKTHRDLYRMMEQLYSRLAAEEQESPAPASDPEEGRVGEIRQYIRTHYDDPQLSVSSVAEAFGMSANGLSQMFSRKAEGGVLDYIHEVRMKQAGELLRKHKDMAIQDAAAMVGYTSILTFNRKFKSYYRQTPSEFRKSGESGKAR